MPTKDCSQLICTYEGGQVTFLKVAGFALGYAAGVQPTSFSHIGVMSLYAVGLGVAECLKGMMFDQ